MNTKLINRILNLVVIMALALSWQSVTSAKAAPTPAGLPVTTGSHALNSEPSLIWNTFLEYTNGADFGNGIALDSGGYIYVTGSSHATWGTPLRAYSGGVQDAYIAKLNLDGSLIWSTFIGGAGTDYGRGIAVDGSGHVFVTGSSDATWGTPVRPFTSNQYYSTVTDAFVAQLSSDGALIWSTFLGGLGSDNGYGIAVDGSNDVFVTGSSDFTWGTPVRAFSNDHYGSGDAFVAKLSSSGALRWNTFLGGNIPDGYGIDEGHAITLDSSGAIYISGSSGGTWGSPIRAFTPGTKTDGYAVWPTTDAFIVKLTSGGALTWNTFLGSKGDDAALGIAVDSGGKVDVTGSSDTATWGAPVRAYSGLQDAFVAQLNSNGTLTWNTFLGNIGYDAARGIVVDGSGNMFVTGNSDRTWGTPLHAHTSMTSYNAFVAKIDSSGKLQANTFFGCDIGDYGNGIALDGSGNLVVTGYSRDTWGAPLHGTGGNFVAKVDLSLFPSVISSRRASANPSSATSVSFTVAFSRDVTGVDIADFSLTPSSALMGTFINSVTGSGTTYTVTVNTGSGSGFLRLDVIDNDSIIDPTTIPLGGPGSGNGNFIDGQVYGIRVVQLYLPLITKS